MRESKPKVGDKVEIINDEIFNDDLKIGDDGEIYTIGKDFYTILFKKNGITYKQICSDFRQYIKKID